MQWNWNFISTNKILQLCNQINIKIIVVKNMYIEMKTYLNYLTKNYFRIVVMYNKIIVVAVILLFSMSYNAIILILISI